MLPNCNRCVRNNDSRIPLILLLTIAIALRTLGIANEIVELGFGIALGAVAVAVAIAFGLGGREFAKGVLDRLDKSLKGDK